ncbi:hypothetical protein OC834_008000, partial [Tilletia horrida]
MLALCAVRADGRVAVSGLEQQRGAGGPSWSLSSSSTKALSSSSMPLLDCILRVENEVAVVAAGDAEKLEKENDGKEEEYGDGVKKPSDEEEEEEEE